MNNNHAFNLFSDTVRSNKKSFKNQFFLQKNIIKINGDRLRKNRLKKTRKNKGKIKLQKNATRSPKPV